MAFFNDVIEKATQPTQMHSAVQQTRPIYHRYVYVTVVSGDRLTTFLRNITVRTGATGFCIELKFYTAFCKDICLSKS